ncbi:MAG: hypothetical protein A2X08_13525 [Bacteroidetes bacterium GWA2_32_17]|nr:MAG: hypothetical protein A2X08_13525 [Bacteroidetes bacterium GWA2_32_17]
MKKLILSIVSVAISYLIFAQAPQSLQYQAVVRDVNGVALINQPVYFQLSIIPGLPTNPAEYVETHTGTLTNAFGIVTLSVGSGITTDNFTAINWGTAPHFIKVEADLGSGLIDMGTTQLLSVPYALYSETAGNVQTYTAGNGISITGNVIDNTAPDQIVNLTGTGATSVTGTYPNFTINSTDANTTYSAGTGIDVTGTTITNTAPDQAVAITGGGATSVTGTYPNFTISSTDNVNDADANPANEIQVLSISNDTLYLSNGGSVFMGNYSDTLWKKSGTDIYNTNFGNVGVGINNPVGRMVVQGSATALPTDPLFEVKNSIGQSVFVVWQDSVQVYINDDAIESNRGGFAVSGRNMSKTFTNNYLIVTPDSSRIWTKDTLKGFGVQNINGANKTSYMQLNPDNYFIGHEAGKSITSGKYNSFIGYQSGYKNNTGKKNYFIGYRSGYNNLSGYSNIFIGDSAGFTNTTGYKNIFIGNQSGLNNIAGKYNVFLGYNAGYSNNADYNVFLGYQSGYSNNADNNSFVGYNAGYSNTSGQNNVFIGKNSGYTNTTGDYNVFLGYNSGYTNNADYNTFLGYRAGQNNSTGTYNVFLGYYAGYSNNANNNVFMGYNAGKYNSTGSDNAFIGYNSGYSNTTGRNNVFLGNLCGYSNLSGFSNLFIGNGAGYNNKYAVYNVLIGDSAGFSIVGSTSTNWPNAYYGDENVYIGYKAGYSTTTGFWNIMIGNMAGYSSTTAKGNVFMGMSAGSNNTTGEDNTFLGFWAGMKNITGGSNVVIGTMSDDLGGNISENVFIGKDAGLASSGNQNVFLGNNAGRGASTASNNVFLGWHAGYFNNGDGNVFIGYDAGSFETGSNKLYIANSPTNPPLIYGDFSSEMIGLGTITPTEKVEIGGTESKIYMNSATSNMLYYNNNGVAIPSLTARSAGTKIVLYPDFTAGSKTDYALGIASSVLWYSIPQNTSAFSHRFYGGTTELMCIRGDGNVGIGTATPNSKFVVADGESNFYSGTYSDPAVGFVYDAKFGGSNYGIAVRGQSYFASDVGIGTSLPATSLHVNHPIGSTNGLSISNATDADRWHFYVHSANTMFLYFNNIQRGSFDAASGAYTALSDKRFKKNITAVKSVMNKLMELQVVEYNFINQTNQKRYIGLIAQDVESVFPSLVSHTDKNEADGENTDIYTLDYAATGVIAIKAIQEQQVMINKLIEENKNFKKLETDYNNLKAEIELLKKK